MAKTKNVIEALDSILPRGSSDGLTVKEICKQTGKTPDWVREKLQMLKEAGILIVERKGSECIDGRTMLIASYKVKDIPKKGR